MTYRFITPAPSNSTPAPPCAGATARRAASMNTTFDKPDGRRSRTAPRRESRASAVRAQRSSRPRSSRAVPADRSLPRLFGDDPQHRRGSCPPRWQEPYRPFFERSRSLAPRRDEMKARVASARHAALDRRSLREQQSLHNAGAYTNRLPWADWNRNCPFTELRRRNQMATETTTTQTTQSTLGEFEKRMVAQIEEADTRIGKFEEKAKDVQAEGRSLRHRRPEGGARDARTEAAGAVDHLADEPRSREGGHRRGGRVAQDVSRSVREQALRFDRQEVRDQGPSAS